VEIKNSFSFENNFLKEYMSRGFATLSKREIDVLMMHILMKYSDISDESNFELSLKLKLSESKIKNLKYEARLKYDNNDE